MLHDEFEQELKRRNSKSTQPAQTHQIRKIEEIDFVVRSTPVSCAAKLLFFHLLSSTGGLVEVDIQREFKFLKRGCYLRQETIIKCLGELYAMGILNKLEFDDTDLLCRVSINGIRDIIEKSDEQDWLL